MPKHRLESLLTGLNSPDKKVRQTAASELGELGDLRALEPLINALDDTDPGVVSAAAWALGRLGHERAIEPLMRYIDKFGVVQGLLFLGPNALLAAINALQTTSERNLYNALHAIRQFLFRHRSWARPIIEQQAFEKIIHILNDADAENRGLAVIVLEDIGDARAAEHIQELGDDPSDHVRWCVAYALGKLGDDSALPVLMKMSQVDEGVIQLLGHDEVYSEKISDVAAQSMQEIQQRIG